MGRGKKEGKKDAQKVLSFNRILAGFHGIWLRSGQKLVDPVLGRPHVPGADLGGRAHANGVVLSKRRTSAFQVSSRKSLLRTPSKNPSQNIKTPFFPVKPHCKTPSKNPSNKNLLESSLENPSKNPSEKGALLHAPIGLAWLALQSLAVKKTTFFFLCKFRAVKNFYNLLKSAGEIFLSGLRGANNF